MSSKLSEAAWCTNWPCLASEVAPYIGIKKVERSTGHF